VLYPHFLVDRIWGVWYLVGLKGDEEMENVIDFIVMLISSIAVILIVCGFGIWALATFMDWRDLRKSSKG